MNIVDLALNDESAIEQVAAILVEGFAAHWPEAWSDIEAGHAEVRESFGPGCISRIAVDESSEIPGWIAGQSHYIRNLQHHPYEFYQKLGYVIVGVIPAANGIGKPDILMAKSVER